MLCLHIDDLTKNKTEILSLYTLSSAACHKNTTFVPISLVEFAVIAKDDAVSQE